MLKFGLVILVFLTGAVQAATTEWLDFELKDNAIQFPVVINGQPGNAILDPTSRVNMLSPGFVAGNKQQLRQTGVTVFRDDNGERNAEVFQQVKVGIFGVDLTFNDMIADARDRASLVLGIPFFRSYIVQIDFPKRKMRLIGRKDLNMKKVANTEMRPQVDSKVASTFGAQSIKSNDQSARAVKVVLNGQPLWLTLDFTNGAGVLTTRETATKLNALTKAYAGDSSLIAKTLPAAAEFYTVDTLKIGPFELEGVLLGVETENGKRLYPAVKRGDKTGTYVNKAVLPDGVLGLDLLQHLIVTYDYTDALIALNAE